MNRLLKLSMFLALAGMFSTGFANTAEPSNNKITPQTNNRASTQTTNGTIAEVALSDKRFSTWVKVIKAAGLEQTLEGRGPFTVFAPTNAAFAKLPKGTLANLLKPENKDKLRNLILDHVVSGSALKGNMQIGDIKAAGGQQLSITEKHGKMYLNNDAQITKKDIAASNGVIHPINRVILIQAR